MSDRIDIAIRLVEERTRLGYTQADFAHQVNVSREGLRLYESGQRGISAEFLVKAAELGVDVQYVLVGLKSENLPQKLWATKDQGINVHGNVNNSVITGSGSTVNHIHTDKHVTKVSPHLTPGNEHITDTMAANLKRLVDEIVELESKLRKNPKSYQAVWASLNKHMKVPQYRCIPIEFYNKSYNYLSKWIGRLTSMKSAPKLGSEWRKRKYAYIKINTSNGLEPWLKDLLEKKYYVGSISELSDDQLQKVYASVASKKRSITSN